MAGEKRQQAGLKGIRRIPHLRHLHRNGPFRGGDAFDPVAIAIAPNPARTAPVVLTAQKRRDFLFEEFLNDSLRAQGQ